MARDDYYVIVYQILSYLYQCLKKGIEVRGEYLKPYSDLYGIELNNNYWAFIMENLVKEKYINGIIINKSDDKINISALDNAKITPKGIEFLLDNNLMNKAKEFAENISNILPLIIK